jgi:hypothetical protein
MHTNSCKKKRKKEKSFINIIKPLHMAEWFEWKLKTFCKFHASSCNTWVLFTLSMGHALKNHDLEWTS